MKWSGALFKAQSVDFELDPRGKEKLSLSFKDGKGQHGLHHPFNQRVPVEHVHIKHHMVTIK